jgi:hypothetical protein
MNAPAIASLTLVGFEVVPLIKEDALDLMWRGNADMHVSAALKTYLKDLDAEVRRLHVNAVRADLNELYFVSSSCFQAMATWLASVSARRGSGGYKVTFTTHPAHPWQKRSLEALRRIAPEVVAVL